MCPTCTNCTSDTALNWLAAPSQSSPTTYNPAYEFRPYQHVTLLSLPPEIRQKIWRYLFSLRPSYPAEKCSKCGHIPLQCLRTSISHSPDKAANQSVLASLRTCKLIQNEAGHLFYSVNLLSVNSPAALYQFLSNLGPRQRESIVSLHVSNVSPRHWTTTQVAPQAFSLLSLCSRLQDCFIDFSIDDTVESRLGPLLESVFDHDRLQSSIDTSDGTEYDDSIFLRGFQALAHQRNLARVGLRGRYGDALGTNPAKIMEKARPYACEDIVFKTMNEVPVELLRTQMQRPRLKVSTRLERARTTSTRKICSAQTIIPTRDYTQGDRVPIRRLSRYETQLEQTFTLQKSKIKHLFDHQRTPPIRCRDNYHV